MALLNSTYTNELLEKPRSGQTIVPWRLFVFSIAIVLIVLIVYFGLLFGYKPYLRGAINDHEQELASLIEAVPEADRTTFLRFYGQLVNIERILNRHVAVSSIFPLLERTTNNQVFYNRLTADVSKRLINLEGVASSYAILAEQAASFDVTSDITRFFINRSQLDNGRVAWSATLELKPELFLATP